MEVPKEKKEKFVTNQEASPTWSSAKDLTPQANSWPEPPKLPGHVSSGFSHKK